MAWNYADEESLIEHIRKMRDQEKQRVLDELEEAYDGHEDDYADDYEEEDEYETYVKYIAVRNTGMMRDFEHLQELVNKFIEEQDDSFILEGPVQISNTHIVQTLINEEEM